MFSKIAIRLIIIIGVLGCASIALSQDRVRGYFSSMAVKVQATADPVQKREILTKDLSAMSQAIETAKSAPMTSQEDRANLDRFNATLQEKSDELAGTNGYDRVPDEQLNAFAAYIVQDMEQADETITISLVVALLIVIIIILIA